MSSVWICEQDCLGNGHGSCRIGFGLDLVELHTPSFFQLAFIKFRSCTWASYLLFKFVLHHLKLLIFLSQPRPHRADLSRVEVIRHIHPHLYLTRFFENMLKPCGSLWACRTEHESTTQLNKEPASQQFFDGVYMSQIF